MSPNKTRLLLGQKMSNPVEKDAPILAQLTPSVKQKGWHQCSHSSRSHYLG